MACICRVDSKQLNISHTHRICDMLLPHTKQKIRSIRVVWFNYVMIINTNNSSSNNNNIKCHFCNIESKELIIRKLDHIVVTVLVWLLPLPLSSLHCFCFIFFYLRQMNVENVHHKSKGIFAPSQPTVRINCIINKI